MQQVDKKNYKYIVMISFITIFLLVGCSSKDPYKGSSKYFDNNITKDQLLHAAKRVFTLSDKNAFIIDAYRNELNVTKTKAEYRIYDMKIRNDHSLFVVDQNKTKKNIKATLSLYQTYGIDDEDKTYIPLTSNAYELFWSRIDYLIGLSEDWESCSYDNINEFFCDFIDLSDNDAELHDLIDLNVSNNSQNINIEKIKINTSYTPTTKDNLMLEERVIHTHITESKGIKKDQNITMQSFKITEYKKQDFNSTKSKWNKKDSVLETNTTTK